MAGCLCVHFFILRLTPIEHFALKLTQTYESAYILSREDRVSLARHNIFLYTLPYTHSQYSVYTIDTQDINVKNAIGIETNYKVIFYRLWFKSLHTNVDVAF